MCIRDRFGQDHAVELRGRPPRPLTAGRRGRRGIRDRRSAGQRRLDADPVSYTHLDVYKRQDWLTTIIIGLGLVNLAKVGPALGDLSNTLKKCLGGACYAGIVGVSVITITLVTSIILCYLWTSLRVRELMERCV